jgi:hypothetical protein
VLSNESQIIHAIQVSNEFRRAPCVESNSQQTTTTVSFDLHFDPNQSFRKTNSLWVIESFGECILIYSPSACNATRGSDQSDREEGLKLVSSVSSPAALRFVKSLLADELQFFPKILFRDLAIVELLGKIKST